MNLRTSLRSILVALSVFAAAGCGSIPLKQYYTLNYLPSPSRARCADSAYPCIIRLRDFDIEEAYDRPEIVYRQSPFQLQYDYYRSWAVKPSRMITDLVYKHLLTAALVSGVVRRYDEGPKPGYELSGMIEAIDEYDSQELWFAHLALRMTLTKIADGAVLFEKRFDLRKRVYEHKPENVIRELSTLLELVVTQAVGAMDKVLAREYGMALPPNDTSALTPSTGEIR